MGGDAVFVVKGALKRYGERAVVSDIDLEVRRGEILGIIGASGAGKTTLLNMLVGFVPSTRGSVAFCTSDGKSFDVLRDQRVIARAYGFASQYPSFYEKLTVRENLLYFGTSYGLSDDTCEKNASTLIRLMGLTASTHVLAEHLSGGMKRRLDIACALIHNPSVLILDEPTADLDPVLRNQIWEVIMHVNRKGTTVILSSHHLNELDTLCTRIAVLKAGKIVDIDSPARLKHKYSKDQEIVLESFPGNYERILARMKAEGQIHGATLTIRTPSPEEMIPRLLAALKRENESLLDLKLVKPNLDNVFTRIHAR